MRRTINDGRAARCIDLDEVAAEEGNGYRIDIRVMLAVQEYRVITGISEPRHLNGCHCQLCSVDFTASLSYSYSRNVVLLQYFIFGVVDQFFQKQKKPDFFQAKLIRVGASWGCRVLGLV